MTEILRRFENGQSSLASPSGDDAGSSVHDVLGRKIDRAMEEDARDGDEDENENEELARIFEGMDIGRRAFGR